MGENRPQKQIVILIAEDNQINLLLVKDALISQGYTVITASDGNSALELFQHNYEQISLAILDISLPKPDGFELCREFRKMRPNLPIMLISGYTGEDIWDRIAGMQNISFLQKPYRLKQLRQLVANTVGASPP